MRHEYYFFWLPVPAVKNRSRVLPAQSASSGRPVSLLTAQAWAEEATRRRPFFPEKTPRERAVGPRSRRGLREGLLGAAPRLRPSFPEPEPHVWRRPLRSPGGPGLPSLQDPEPGPRSYFPLCPGCRETRVTLEPGTRATCPPLPATPAHDTSFGFPCRSDPGSRLLYARTRGVCLPRDPTSCHNSHTS